MNILLDTCIILRLIKGEYDLIDSSDFEMLTNSQNVLFTSVVSLWEIVIKAQKQSVDFHLEDFLEALSLNEIQILSIETVHLVSLMRLPFYHKDPFDRLIIAQALSSDMKIITTDRIFSHYL